MLSISFRRDSFSGLDRGGFLGCRPAGTNTHNVARLAVYFWAQISDGPFSTGFFFEPWAFEERRDNGAGLGEVLRPTQGVRVPGGSAFRAKECCEVDCFSEERKLFWSEESLLFSAVTKKAE